MKCAECGEPIKVPWNEDSYSHFCDICAAELDAQIAADDAELDAMLEDADTPLSPDLLTDEVPTSQQLLERQRAYTAEDHKWNMDH
jgi:hypothetical protein